MSTDSIVEDFDVFENLLSGLRTCDEQGFVDELDLERSEEALGHRVVPAVALTTHAAFDAAGLEEATVNDKTVLFGRFDMTLRPIVSDCAESWELQQQLAIAFIAGDVWQTTRARDNRSESHMSTLDAATTA